MLKELENCGVTIALFFCLFCCRFFLTSDSCVWRPHTMFTNALLFFVDFFYKNVDCNLMVFIWKANIALLNDTI